MKDWAKKLEDMISNPSIELTDEEAAEMMTDIVAGANIEGFNVHVLSATELEELDALFPYDTPTIH